MLSFTSPPKHSSGSRAPRWWKRLTAPSPALTRPGERRKAQLLTTLLLFFIPLTAVVGIYLEYQQHGAALLRQTDFYLTLAVLSVLTTAYFFSRTRYYQPTAVLVVGMLSAAVFLTTLPVENESALHTLLYLLIPLLLSAMLLSFAATALLAVLQLAGMMTVYNTTDYAGPNHTLPVLIFTISMMVLFLMHHNRRVAQDQQAELQANEAYNRALLNAMPDLLFQITREGRFCGYKDAGMGLLIPPEQFLGRTVSEVMPSPMSQKTMAYIQQALDTGQVQVMEYQLPAPDGDGLNDYEARVVPSGADEVLVIVRDMTEQKRAERALRESEDKFAKAFHTSPDAAGITRLADGQYLEVNEGFTILSGYTSAEVIGRSSLEINIWDDPADRARMVELLRAHGEVQGFEAQFRARDGRLITGLMSARVIEINGELCILSITRDITDRKQAELALQRSEARNRALLAAVPDLMFNISRAGVYLDAQVGAGEELLAAPVAQMIGHPMSHFLPPHIAALIQATIERTLNTGAPQVCEYWLDVPAGRRYFEARMAVSGPDEVLLMARDVTERYQAEQALRRRDAILQALAYINEQLLRAADSHKVLPNLLAQLAQAIGVEKASVWQNLSADPAIIQTRLAHLWLAPGLTIPPDLDQHLAYEISTADLQTLLGDSLTFSGSVNSLAPQFRALLRAYGIESVAAAPVISEEGLWGFVTFGSAQAEYDWQPVELEALRSLAGALGAAIVRQHSEAAEREQRRLAEKLAEMAAALSRVQALDEVIDCVFDSLHEIFPHDAANIMLIEGDRAQVVRTRAYLQSPEVGDVLGVEIDVADIPNLRAIQTGAPTIVPDTRADPAWQVVPQLAWVRSYIGVPLRAGSEVFGFLNLDSATPGTFGPQHAERLQAFADQAANAIRNARSAAAERAERAFSDALRVQAAALAGSLDLDDVLRQILARIQQVVPHTAANIMLVEGERLRIVRSQGYADLDEPGQEIQDQVFYFEQRPRIRRVLETGQGYWVTDTRTYSEWVDPSWILSHVCAPIRFQNQTLGVINLDGDQPGMFGPAEADRLQAFADQVAVAVRNAQLYDELRRHADELAWLNRAVSFLFTSLPATADVALVGQTIAEAITHEFHQADCAVLLADYDTGQFDLLGHAGEYNCQRSRTLTLEGPGLIATAVQTGEAVYVPDVTSDSRYLKCDARTQSELVLPLLTAGGIIGAIDLQSPRLNAFSEQDRRILAAFAERAAAVIENRQLYAALQGYAEELEQRVNERTADLSVRNAVAETLSSSLDMHQMLNGVLHTTVEQLGVLGGAIYLLSPDSTSLQLAAHCGVPPETLSLVTGITPGITNLSLGGMPNLNHDTGILAVLSVPIWRQGQIQGVITLVHDQARPWDDDETRMIDAIGRQIGVALANAQLYDEAVRGEAHIRTILQSVADGLLVFDQDNHLILMNPAAEALVAFYPEEYGGAVQAAGRLWDWLRAARARQQDPGGIELNLPTEPLVKNSSLVLQNWHLAQQCRWFDPADPAWPCWLKPGALLEQEVHFCPLLQRISQRAIQAHCAEVREAGGAVMGTVIVLHDVTYYHELDQLKGRFVSTVSHELRTPLATVLLQVSTLLKYYHRFEDERRREMLAEIKQQAQVLAELIEDILELSRFDARRALPQKRWFDLAAQCHETIAAMRGVIEDKRLQVQVLDGGTSCMVWGDPNQLERVFRNLLANAVKYTPENGQITIRLEQLDQAIRLTVEDTGIGIAPDDQLYIFDRFFRAEEASRMASGTGLGLAITKEIVDLHNGTIEVRSLPGKGSIFMVTLPVTLPQPAAQPG